MNKKDKFLEALELNLGNITKACRVVGINRQTYYLWIKNEEFKEKVDEVQENLIELVEGELFKLIKSGHYKSIELFLKSKGKSKGYSTKQEIDLSGSIDNCIII